jgi:hypothetical protein
MIKSLYRTNDTVFVFDEEGLHLPQYDGKFVFLRDRILADLAPNAEFYISRWGQGNFEKVTKEQWLSEEI